MIKNSKNQEKIKIVARTTSIQIKIFLYDYMLLYKELMHILLSFYHNKKLMPSYVKIYGNQCFDGKHVNIIPSSGVLLITNKSNDLIKFCDKKIRELNFDEYGRDSMAQIIFEFVYDTTMIKIAKERFNIDINEATLLHHVEIKN